MSGSNWIVFHIPTILDLTNFIDINNIVKSNNIFILGGLVFMG